MALIRKTRRPDVLSAAIWQLAYMNKSPALTPLPRDQRKIDADYLNLLAIFLFVSHRAGLHEHELRLRPGG